MPNTILSAVSPAHWNGLPLNYLDTWTQWVQKLITADISASFAHKLRPEKLEKYDYPAAESYLTSLLEP